MVKLSKTISQTVQVPSEEPIGMDNLPQLPVDASELEALLERLGADIAHPVPQDPVAKINGELVAFWTE